MFEKLTDHLGNLSDTISGLFSTVLERLERDHGLALTDTTLSFIELSRNGMLESEMVELLYEYVLLLFVYVSDMIYPVLKRLRIPLSHPPSPSSTVD